MHTSHLEIARDTLLSPYSLTDSSIETVFGDIMTHDADYADLYFQYSRSEGWSLEEGRVKSGSFNIDQGVGVRVVSGEKTAFAYSDDISLPALRDAAVATRSIARAGGNGSAKAIAKNLGSRASSLRASSLYTPNDPISSLSDAEKVRILERLEQFARAIDPRVKEVSQLASHLRLGVALAEDLDGQRRYPIRNRRVRVGSVRDVFVSDERDIRKPNVIRQHLMRTVRAGRNADVVVFEILPNVDSQ